MRNEAGFREQEPVDVQSFQGLQYIELNNLLPFLFAPRLPAGNAKTKLTKSMPKHAAVLF